VEAEIVRPAAMRPWGKLLLGLFLTVFLFFLVMLAFRDAVAGWLEPHGFTIPAAPAMLVGKPPLLRVLFSLATLAIPFLLSFFPLYAALRGVRVYEQFVEGAKEAFGTAQRVIPFLVAMLVSIAMLREAGVFDTLQKWLGPLFLKLNFPADLLPMVLIRPMSGSATTGIFVELVQRFGADSLIARTAATIYGSTETTFYVIAIYFGSVAVRQTRHAVAAGLAADLTAVVASVLLCRLFFPA
jgi:spore maturation protein B